MMMSVSLSSSSESDSESDGAARPGSSSSSQASECEEYALFFVDGSKPPREQHGGLVGRVYLCQVGGCQGRRHGG